MLLFDSLQIPKNKLDFFIRSVEISSYIPGRIRLHSKALIGNESAGREVKRQLLRYQEISEVETNAATGSILIRYTPQLLHTNAELTRAEEYIKTHVKPRAHQ